MHIKAITLATALAFSGAAQAATINWNTWQANGTGSMGATTITYTGENDGVRFDTLYTPASSFADGSIVANAPTSANGIRALIGGNSGTNTITFSSAVVDPVFTIWSLGQGGIQASFVFDRATPVFVAGGPASQYGGSAITVSGNTVFGSEGNGTVKFIGTYTSLSWTNPVAENYYGFNVGVAAVPEPAEYGMLLLGLGAVGFMARRRRG